MKKEIKEKGKGFVQEFKDFIKKGNVMDLAVGVIIGGAFGKIVTSVVDDILMPFFGVILGGLDFSNLSFTIGNATIKYGSFINNVINFLIIALCIFIMVKAINKIANKEEKTKEAPKKPADILLLEEIRDELKKQNKNL